MIAIRKFEHTLNRTTFPIFREHWVEFNDYNHLLVHFQSNQHRILQPTAIAYNVERWFQLCAKFDWNSRYVFDN